MSLSYSSQITSSLVGSKTTAGVRTSIALLSTYDATTTKQIETGGFVQIVVDVLYTTGAAETNNSIEMRVKVSNDKINFYQIANEAVSAGVSTLTQREFTLVGASAATAYTISVPLDVMYKFMEFSFKETGVAANVGSVFAEYTLSGK